MDLYLQDKVAIVGGSSQGIGFAAAMSLAREGASVVITARHRDPLKEAAASIKSINGSEVMPIVADLSKATDTKYVFDETIRGWGKVDIVINNLGGPPAGDLLEFSDEQWQAAFNLSFSSAVRMNRLVLPGMRVRKFGRIINVLSKTIREPEDRLALSTVARTALASYSHLLAQEVAIHGVTVNNILPGSVATQRLQSVIEFQAIGQHRTVEEQTLFRLSNIPAGRFGRPEEVGNLIAFLSSDQSAFVTGQNIAIDGGQIKGLH